MFTQESNRAGDIFAWQTFPLPQLVPSRAGPDLAIICLKIFFFVFLLRQISWFTCLIIQEHEHCH